MSMFDSIKCELPLPSLPQGVLNQWVLKKDNETPSSGDVIFQTKDTPNQGMSLYKIDSTGQLLEERVEGYREEPELIKKDDGDKLAPYPSFLTALGKYVETSRSWEEVNFTGPIDFYESYNHPETPKYNAATPLSDEYLRFKTGWVEYKVMVLNGKVQGDVILVNLLEPIKLTDDELAVQIAERVKRREESAITFKTNRKKYPSTEQKLIDSIYKISKDAEVLQQIDEYREQHDIWYTNED